MTKVKIKPKKKVNLMKKKMVMEKMIKIKKVRKIVTQMEKTKKKLKEIKKMEKIKKRQEMQLPKQIQHQIKMHNNLLIHQQPKTVILYPKTVMLVSYKCCYHPFSLRCVIINCGLVIKDIHVVLQTVSLNAAWLTNNVCPLVIVIQKLIIANDIFIYVLRILKTFFITFYKKLFL